MLSNMCCRRARLRAGTAAVAILALCAIPALAEATTRAPVVTTGGHLPADRLDPITPETLQAAAATAAVVVPPRDLRADAIQAVIDTALAQLGDPYYWGGSGPDSFDCSGFTAFAWRAAGVELDHYTGSQFGQTTQVSVDELQPGDLVFYGMGHVALYLGDGQIIHAPHRGDVVKIDPVDVWRSPTVASRPEPIL